MARAGDLEALAKRVPRPEVQRAAGKDCIRSGGTKRPEKWLSGGLFGSDSLAAERGRGVDAPTQ